MTAPESQPLTEAEWLAIHDAPRRYISTEVIDRIAPVVAQIIANRTAVLLDRLKAAERERDLAFAAMTNASDLVRITDINSLLAHAKTIAEADKARAVAEALTQVATAMPACTEPGAFCPCDAVARIVRHPGWVADHD